MSVKVMGWVFDLDIPTREKFVLLAYADHANHDGSSIYPAVETVAKKTGYNERTVQRATQELVKMGILIKDGFGPKGTHRWQINKSWGGVPQSPQGVTESHPDTQSPRTTVTRGVTHSPKRGVPQSPEPSRTVIKPSLSAPSQTQEMFGILADITGIDYKLNPGKIGKFILPNK
jgi:hypothetical protein